MSTPIYLNNQSKNPYFLEDAEALPVFGESLASVASVTSVNGRKGDVILKTNDLENNSGYITKEVEDLTNYTRTDELPTKLSQFENDEDFQNGEQVGDAITTAIAEHNSSLDSHEDIRENIEQLDNDLSTAKGNITALENRVTADEGQLSTLEGATEALGSRLTTAESDIDTIESKIPNAATQSNQLADKSFVNSSIATNTANFKGTFQSVEELEQVQDATNNDYAFVEVTDGENSAYDRYKYVADPGEWVFEYELNNSSFTQAQWDAINSGITSGNVEKLQNLVNITSIGENLTLLNGELSADAANYTAGDGINIANNTISATNTGKARELTAADYDYPADNPTSVALWRLEPGIYSVGDSVKTRVAANESSTYARLVIIARYGTIAREIIELDWVTYAANNAPAKFTIVNEYGGEYGSGIFLGDRNVVDNLTTTSTGSPLSAKQGKVLNDKIGGDLSNLTTTDKTSLIAAINELNTNLGAVNTALQTLLNGTGA